jgi:hypothetical protein
VAKSHLQLAHQLKFYEQFLRSGQRTELRTREHLVPSEVEALMEAVKATGTVTGTRR